MLGGNLEKAQLRHLVLTLRAKIKYNLMLQCPEPRIYLQAGQKPAFLALGSSATARLSKPASRHQSMYHFPASQLAIIRVYSEDDGHRS